MSTLPEICSEDFSGVQWIEMPEEAYHADKSAVSSTGVRDALKSARTFYRRHVLCIDQEERSDSMQFGSLVHLAVLEPDRFKRLVRVMPDFGNMRTNAAKEKRDAWLGDLPDGSMTLDANGYERIMRMIDSVLGYQGGMVSRILNGSVFEKTGYFRDPTTGLKCRMRPDALREDLTVLADLKTTRDASREYFSRAIWNYRYDMQMAFYAHGVQQMHGRPPDTACFIAVENQEPFHTCVYECSPAMLERGMHSVDKGLATIKKAVLSDSWPGMQENGAEVIDLPSWTDNALEEM